MGKGKTACLSWRDNIITNIMHEFHLSVYICFERYSNTIETYDIDKTSRRMSMFFYNTYKALSFQILLFVSILSKIEKQQTNNQRLIDISNAN